MGGHSRAKPALGEARDTADVDIGEGLIRLRLVDAAVLYFASASGRRRAVESGTISGNVDIEVRTTLDYLVSNGGTARRKRRVCWT
jgi:hypothetical protein